MDKQEELFERAVIRQCYKDLGRINKSFKELCDVEKAGYTYLSSMDIEQIDRGVILGFVGVMNFISQNLNEELGMIVKHLESVREPEETGEEPV